MFPLDGAPRTRSCFLLRSHICQRQTNLWSRFTQIWIQWSVAMQPNTQISPSRQLVILKKFLMYSHSDCDLWPLVRQTQSVDCHDEVNVCAKLKEFLLRTEGKKSVLNIKLVWTFFHLLLKTLKAAYVHNHFSQVSAAEFLSLKKLKV